MNGKLHLYEASSVRSCEPQSVVTLSQDGRKRLLRAVAVAAYTFNEKGDTESEDEMWELHSSLTDLTDECGDGDVLEIKVKQDERF